MVQGLWSLQLWGLFGCWEDRDGRLWRIGRRRTTDDSDSHQRNSGGDASPSWLLRSDDSRRGHGGLQPNLCPPVDLLPVTWVLLGFPTPQRQVVLPNGQVCTAKNGQYISFVTIWGCLGVVSMYFMGVVVFGVEILCLLQCDLFDVKW